MGENQEECVRVKGVKIPRLIKSILLGRGWGHGRPLVRNQRIPMPLFHCCVPVLVHPSPDRWHCSFLVIEILHVTADGLLHWRHAAKLPSQQTALQRHCGRHLKQHNIRNPIQEMFGRSVGTWQILLGTPRLPQFILTVRRI
jgi:hypothetical protein